MKNIITTLVLILAVSAISLAQNFSGPPSFNPDVLDNPIDGGLGLLLGAGAAYGAKKLRDHRRKRQENEDIEH